MPGDPAGTWGSRFLTKGDWKLGLGSGLAPCLWAPWEAVWGLGPRDQEGGLGERQPRMRASRAPF